MWHHFPAKSQQLQLKKIVILRPQPHKSTTIGWELANEIMKTPYLFIHPTPHNPEVFPAYMATLFELQPPLPNTSPLEATTRVVGATLDDQSFINDFKFHLCGGC